MKAGNGAFEKKVISWMGMAGERICHPVVSDKLTRQCMCCYFFFSF
jgi:hypothetical protein